MLFRSAQVSSASGASPTTPTATTVVVPFPPRNETLDFRQQLETKYRDGLGRAALAVGCCQ